MTELNWKSSGKEEFDLLCTNPRIAEHVYKMGRAEENGTITSSKSRIIFVHMIIYLPFQCFHQWSGKWGRDEDEFLVKSVSHFVIFLWPVPHFVPAQEKRVMSLLLIEKYCGGYRLETAGINGNIKHISLEFGEIKRGKWSMLAFQS